MEKIKEIKSSRDGSAKAEKYVSGFLRIPFGSYIEEPILSFLDEYSIKLKAKVDTIIPGLKKYEDLTCYEDFFLEFDFISYEISSLLPVYIYLYIFLLKILL